MPRTEFEKILIVDDDRELASLLKDYLSTEGLTIETVHDGKRGLERSLSGEYDLVILDVMLPEMGGFDVLRHLRGKSNVPVIMLTAKGDDVDRIVGLELGADDYLPKPFNARELLARIRAVMRRSARNQSVDMSALSVPETIEAGPLKIDVPARQVSIGGEGVECTSVEFEILKAFAKRPGEVLSREELVEQILGREFSPFDRSIDVHVSRLRKKMGRYGDLFKSVRGEGYVFAFPPEKEEG